MALLSKNKFKELANKRGHYCISIYIPTYRDGDNQKGTIRLKNQLAKIETQLFNLEMNRNEVAEYIKPINKLLNDAGLWRHLSDSLIIFRSAEDFIYLTLPIDVNELSLVSDRYYLLPLLNMFTDDDTFFILTLSQNKNQVYQATKNEITEFTTKGMLPEKLEESVGKDVKQKSLQFRTGQSQGGLGLYHGKGEGKDDKKKEIIKYLRDVDQGINELIDEDNAPLVIASVDYIFSLFQDVSAYKNVYPTPVLGNYDDKDILHVHEKACALLKPWFERERNQYKEKYRSSSDNIVSEINAIHRAAIAGSIETLFVKKNEFVWGKEAPERLQIQIHDNREVRDNCLLDIVARHTFLKGGKVFIEESDQMPEQSFPANAILRY